MKLFNNLFFSAAIIALIGSTSCTKEYTCQCTISYSGIAGLPDTVVKEYEIRDTKSKASTICEGNSATIEKDNVTTVETCKLF